MDEGTAFLAGAFVTLVSEAPPGYSGRGMIPVRAIWDWCERRGLAGDEADHAEAVIRAVDAKYLERQADEVKRRAPGPPAAHTDTE